MKYSIQIVGVGGQGVLLASMVLGNAAMSMGYDVSMSEVHGMAQRGGSVLSTVRFGDGVCSPLEAVGSADLILGFEPVETCRNLSLGNKNTAIVMNLDPVLPSMVAAGFEEYPDIEILKKEILSRNSNLITVDATGIALKAGKAVAANAVMIGAMAAVKGFPISKEALFEALIAQVPEKFRELNTKAFEMGYEAVRRRRHTPQTFFKKIQRGGAPLFGENLIVNSDPCHRHRIGETGMPVSQADDGLGYGFVHLFHGRIQRHVSGCSDHIVVIQKPGLRAQISDLKERFFGDNPSFAFECEGIDSDYVTLGTGIGNRIDDFRDSLLFRSPAQTCKNDGNPASAERTPDPAEGSFVCLFVLRNDEFIFRIGSFESRLVGIQRDTDETAVNGIEDVASGTSYSYDRCWHRHFLCHLLLPLHLFKAETLAKAKASSIAL
ncbi:MAG: indolepyruvate oxidoreductase subunit beta [Candidatus Methanomethylophilaceae archaeon]|nr:indolepyruvate oxidoreductase subunit beta [Candidatus Methanomethylophilaceae archaeon]